MNKNKRKENPTEKDFFALFLTMAVVLSLAACGGKKDPAEPAATERDRLH